MSTSPNQPAGNGPWPLWLMIIVGAIVIGAGLFLVQRGKKTGGSDADCEQLTAELNEAVGNLEAVGAGEAKRLPLADKAFSDLARRFPKEPAATRNLAICRAVAFDSLPPEQARVSTVNFKSALDALQKTEPRSPIPHFLAARIAVRQDAIPSAIDEFKKAVELAPEDPAMWYALYEVTNPLGESDPSARLTSREALAGALKADPANSYLLKEQVLAQVKDQDPEAIETLKSLIAQVEPLLSVIKQRYRVDVKELAERVAKAVSDGKWQPAQNSATVINNVIKSEEWVRSDLRRLGRHPLAYVVTGFSSAVCANPHPTTGEESPVSFHLQPADAGKQLPELAGVLALNLSDFDLDGIVDVLALRESELKVLSRIALGKPWQESLTVSFTGPLRGMLVGDLDRDELKHKPVPAADAKTLPSGTASAPPKSACQPADVEVVVFGPAGVQIFRNDLDDDGKRVLVAVEQSAELAGLKDVLAGVLADVDHDGDLDLVFSAESGISVWANVGQLKFNDITERSALPPQELAATTLVAVDWDRDLDLDILVSGPNAAPSGWLENLRHGSLRWRPFEDELAGLSGSNDLRILEIDGNASWDVVGVGAQGCYLARTRTDLPGIVKSLDFSEIVKEPLVRSLVGDFDNDTHPDLVAWGEAGLKVMRGTSAARFEAADVLNPPAEMVATCAIADLDEDGDLDLVAARPDRLVLYDNDGGNKNHWLAVRAMGQAGDNTNAGDVNHLGIGSLLELKTSRRYQAQVITGQVTHFGLGKQDSADVLRVVWTNGVPQPVVAPQADTSLCRVHVISTSCPYFYTWDGEKFAFCTDACWAAPLGLQLAEGVFAQPRAWEYLAVSGERLKPKDGKYVIQMTEELWEATYLDRMELLVVDHPADVEIFSNEKVGPPELAEFKIHTVRDRRLPVAARDKHGRDVLEEIGQEDGVFMKGFDRDPRRGLTDEHYLELDLGKLDHPRQITLFVTGWLFPASTSLNVGISQDRSLSQARPPAIEVPDEQGNWRLVRPYMGFPGGRTKTIAVDLSGLFLTDDYRLRIVTNMEFCWDAAFFTVDEQSAPLEVQHLAVSSADLHYRGYSAIVPRPGFGPDGYDYSRVSILAKWAPMAGHFTRFGDVTELLQEADDLQVVFGSGDELTVAFDVPDRALPSGWKRDFLLYNVGWDKDNDLNVVTSQAVEPLPFHGMSGYPYGAEEQYPDTPRHRAYLRKYQTRVPWPMPFWREVQRFEAE